MPQLYEYGLYVYNRPLKETQKSPPMRAFFAFWRIWNEWAIGRTRHIRDKLA